jgi:hypothetical protein
MEYLPQNRTKWYLVQLPDLNETDGFNGGKIFFNILSPNINKKQGHSY